MRKIIGLLAASLVLILPSKASAVALCTGTVTHVYVYAGGSVHVYGSWRNHLTQICNVEEEWKGITPQTCFSWFSAISNANVENKTVGIYYSGIDQSQCSTLPTYGGAPAPVYVRLS